LELVGALRAQVQSLDNNLPVFNVNAMEDVVSGLLAWRRFNMILLALFAGIALALAVVGIYGVISFSVAQRTHEIGIRMALGAHRGDVLRLVLRWGTLLIALGVALGLGAALVLTRLLASFLFGVSPVDLLTFASVPLVLGAIALLGIYLPARRATRIDPMAALRYE
ncbi:MAG: FtsX-like permease family protein, partial [Terriglobia bacterium]